jgi:hypothetical protein
MVGSLVGRAGQLVLMASMVRLGGLFLHDL